ncbi:MAG: alpha/beta fold hydrolase [Limimaricola sp.]|uniref:alpha/beta fold hydrolase n=1 Tax=Limimaricola sp. TaxID=2211665 RepID=UPI001D2C1047|nr:alpha/beta hydrolase [Limimaricola sp.]MBI1416149.1 alpha/beta fold hydrolase [Limimaricola sp.]
MEAAPYFAEIADGPKGGAAHWLRADDGVRIRVAHWPVTEAQGTVLMFPGRTEFVEKFGRPAGELAARGFASIAVDWRGQGLADRLSDNRKLGHVEHFSDYQRDVDAVVAHVRSLALPAPYFLVGHSMGGAIGLRALHRGIDVRAAAFSAPMWGIMMSPALRPVAWTVSTLSKPLGMSRRFAPGQEAEPYPLRQDFAGNTLTSDRDMYHHMRQQISAHPDLALGGPSMHWLHEALTETRELARKKAPAYPCITFLGSEEAIVDVGRIRHVMAGWPGGTLTMLPGAQHEVMMEAPAIRARVYDGMVAHFRAHALAPA